VLSLLLSMVLAITGVIRGESPNFAGLATLGGWAAFAGFLFFFATGLLLRSRTLQDRTFRCTGFVATFFGLAILIVFFWGLLSDVAKWFHYVPRLVAIKNEQTLKKREELKHVAIIRTAKKAELDKEYQQALAGAADDAEKTEITKVYLGTPAQV
jgi:nitrate reductase gamma subunit